jgi:hypothetical protein
MLQSARSFLLRLSFAEPSSINLMRDVALGGAILVDRSPDQRPCNEEEPSEDAQPFGNTRQGSLLFLVPGADQCCEKDV